MLPKKIKYETELPEIGKLYKLRPSIAKVSGCIQWRYHGNNIEWSKGEKADNREGGPWPPWHEQEIDEPVFVVDYLLYNHRKKNRFGGTFGLVVKVMVKQTFFYYTFLVKPKYNEFTHRMKRVESGS